MFGDDWSYKDPWAFKNIRNVDYRFVTIHAGMAKNYPEMKRLDLRWLKKQGRIYGNPVADGWAGAVMRKPIDRHTKTIRPYNLCCILITKL